MVSQSETRISKGHQVVVPAPIRKKYRLDPGDVLRWEEKGSEIRVTPRKRLKREDITGIVGFPGDAVKLKRRVQRGGR